MMQTLYNFCLTLAPLNYTWPKYSLLRETRMTTGKREQNKKTAKLSGSSLRRSEKKGKFRISTQIGDKMDEIEAVDGWGCPNNAENNNNVAGDGWGENKAKKAAGGGGWGAKAKAGGRAAPAGSWRGAKAKNEPDAAAEAWGSNDGGGGWGGEKRSAAGSVEGITAKT